MTHNSSIKTNLRLANTEWQAIDDYAKQFFFSSKTEAIRVLIARTLYSKAKVPAPKYERDSISAKIVIFPKHQWEMMIDYQHTHKIPSKNEAMRQLILRGIAIEKKLWG